MKGGKVERVICEACVAAVAGEGTHRCAGQAFAGTLVGIAGNRHGDDPWGLLLHFTQHYGVQIPVHF